MKDEVLGGGEPVYVDKLKYTRAILDESMRLYPPVPIRIQTGILTLLKD
jgi:cytochrome P450